MSPIMVFENTLYKILEDLLYENHLIFNQHSNNAIIMTTSRIQGDFTRNIETFLGHDLVSARAIEDMETELTAKEFARRERNAVKLAFRMNPIKWSNVEFSWVLQNPKEAAALIAKKLANDILANNAVYAISSLTAVLKSDSRVLHTVTPQQLITHSDLIQAQRPLGDQLDSLALYVMHSTHYYDLMKSTFENAERLWSFGSLSIQRSALGQSFLITDNKGLVDGNDTYCLGLKAGSCRMSSGNDFVPLTTPIANKENIQYQHQAEWTGHIELANHRFKNPDAIYNSKGKADLAKIANATNWDRVDANIKAQTGVIIKTTKG